MEENEKNYLDWEGLQEYHGKMEERLQETEKTSSWAFNDLEERKANINDVYTKSQLNNLITTPNQQYVTVSSFQDLPQVGSPDTIYRVGGESVVGYSEYGWDGTDYVKLDDKNVGIDTIATANSSNLITSGAVYNLITKEVNLIGDTVNLNPNVFYKLGSRSSLTVTFIQGNVGELNEYMFEFTSTTDNFTLNIPTGVKWVEDPEITNGYTYQVSILNNLAIIVGWE